MKTLNTFALCALFLSLTGCSHFKSIDYDDTSIYQYDVDNHPGVGFYEDMDYQDDFYKDSPGIMHQHMQMERDFGYL